MKHLLPISYIGGFDLLRKRFAALEQSRERGYSASTFSFNSGEGRCPTCGGNGFEHVERLALVFDQRIVLPVAA